MMRSPVQDRPDATPLRAESPFKVQATLPRSRAACAIDACRTKHYRRAASLQFFSRFCGIGTLCKLAACHRPAAKKPDAAASASGADRDAASLPQRCRKPLEQASMTVNSLSLLQASPENLLARRPFAVVSPRFGRTRLK
jgi:hypothetical protein